MLHCDKTVHVSGYARYRCCWPTFIKRLFADSAVTVDLISSFNWKRCVWSNSRLDFCVLLWLLLTDLGRSRYTKLSLNKSQLKGCCRVLKRACMRHLWSVTSTTPGIQATCCSSKPPKNVNVAYFHPLPWHQTAIFFVRYIFSPVNNPPPFQLSFLCRGLCKSAAKWAR